MGKDTGDGGEVRFQQRHLVDGAARTPHFEDCRFCFFQVHKFVHFQSRSRQTSGRTECLTFNSAR